MFLTGCLLYVLLAGETPFEGKTFKDLTANKTANNIKKMKFFENTKTPCVIDLINKLMDQDLKKRYTVEEALQHPFVTTEQADYADYIT